MQVDSNSPHLLMIINFVLTKFYLFYSINITAAKKIEGNLVQIMLQKEHEVDKIKEDVGFTVVKVVGNAICELISFDFISNLDQQEFKFFL